MSSTCLWLRGPFPQEAFSVPHSRQKHPNLQLEMENWYWTLEQQQSPNLPDLTTTIIPSYGLRLPTLGHSVIPLAKACDAHSCNV